MTWEHVGWTSPGATTHHIRIPVDVQLAPCDTCRAPLTIINGQMSDAFRYSFANGPTAMLITPHFPDCSEASS